MLSEVLVLRLVDMLTVELGVVMVFREQLVMELGVVMAKNLN